MRLVSTSDILRVVTGSAGRVDVQANWTQAKAVRHRGRTNTSITTATTTTIVTAPATTKSSKLVESMSVLNAHGAVSNLVTVEHFDGSTVAIVFQGTLAPGESADYAEGVFARRAA
jgi:hypothetical protein